MIFLTVLALSILSLVNYRVGGRAIFYPPVIFCGIFALDLFLVLAAGDFFYSLLPATLFIFLSGGVAFSLGSWLAMLFPEGNSAAKVGLPKSSHRMLTTLVALIVAAAPLYFRWLYGLVAAHNTFSAVSFLLLARESTMEAMGHSIAFTIFGTLSQLSVFVALLAFYEREGHAKRAFLAIAVSFAMNFLMGAKGGPLFLVVSLLAIDWLKMRRLRWKLVAVIFLVFVVVTASIEFYVHLGGDSFQEKSIPIAQHFVFYAAGGVVSFDRLVREPNIVPHPNQLQNFVLRVLRRLGSRVDVSDTSEFVAIGPHGLQNNTYTMYSSWLSLGYMGMVIVAGIIGLLVTLIYRRAVKGGMTSVLAYAVLLPALVFSPFSEYFLLVYTWFLVCFVSWLVYALPKWWGQFRRSLQETITSELVARS